MTALTGLALVFNHQALSAPRSRSGRALKLPVTGGSRAQKSKTTHGHARSTAMTFALSGTHQHTTDAISFKSLSSVRSFSCQPAPPVAPPTGRGRALAAHYGTMHGHPWSVPDAGLGQRFRGRNPSRGIPRGRCLWRDDSGGGAARPGRPEGCGGRRRFVGVATRNILWRLSLGTPSSGGSRSGRWMPRSYARRTVRELFSGVTVKSVTDLAGVDHEVVVFCRPQEGAGIDHPQEGAGVDRPSAGACNSHGVGGARPLGPTVKHDHRNYRAQVLASAPRCPVTRRLSTPEGGGPRLPPGKGVVGKPSIYHRPPGWRQAMP